MANSTDSLLQHVPELLELSPSDQLAAVFSLPLVPPFFAAGNRDDPTTFWKMVVQRLQTLAGGPEALEAEMQVPAKDLELALRQELPEAASVALKLVAGSGAFDPPTLFELDAKFTRDWSPQVYADHLHKIHAPVIVPKIPDSADNMFHKNAKPPPQVSRLGTLLELVAPSLAAMPTVRSLLGLSKIREARTEDAALTVRQAVWHKDQAKIAVLFSNDTVGLYNVVTERWDEAVGLIDHEFQRDVSCLEWQPLSASGLALGCENGVCYWTNNLKHMLFLQHSSPITSLSWSPNGRLLATGSSGHATVTIWDVATRTPTHIRRIRGAVDALLWSPSGFYLYAGSQGLGFRVWETKTWSCELYSDFQHPVQAAGWGQCGKTLLVVTGTQKNDRVDPELTLHSFAYAREPPMLGGELLPVTLSLAADVGKEAMLNLKLPQLVRSIALNDTGSRMAVCYEGAPGVVIYAADTHPELKFFHVGTVWGAPGTLPRHVSFKPQCEHGALLCVAFEDTRNTPNATTTLRFIPMHF